MIHRTINAYRTHRWFRWSADLAVVLVLVVVVAVAHTLLLGFWPVTHFHSLLQTLSGGN